MPACSVKQVGSLYELLGVPLDAEHDAISKTYRQLARRLHPDVNPAAHSQFQAVQLAYEVLRDQELRSAYDKYGLKALGSRFTALQQYIRADVRSWPGQRVGERGGDVAAVIGLDLLEAVTGVEKEVRIRSLSSCRACEGSGLAHGATQEPCGTCHGSGRVPRTIWQPSGVKVKTLGQCPACGGKGVMAAEQCGRCEGEGRTKVTRRVSVKVPAGVDEHTLMRLPRLGDAGKRGGDPGDLLLRFQIHESAGITREGAHLHSLLRLDALDALLGAPMLVLTARGQQLLHVPAGTQHGDVLCIEQAGVANVQSGSVTYGNHYFTVKLVVPDGSQWDAQSIAILRSLGERLGAGGGACQGGGKEGSDAASIEGSAMHGPQTQGKTGSRSRGKHKGKDEGREHGDQGRKM